MANINLEIGIIPNFPHYLLVDLNLVCGIMSVSYTHLDVYKRQLWYWVPDTDQINGISDVANKSIQVAVEELND